MEDKKFNSLMKEISAIKNLLVLSLQKSDVKGDQIAKALSISQGRLSQMFATRKNKKKNEAEKHRS